jgi:NAD(P)-dependent dehydrogenase (short-subunit alcohol dehydrogenase family)
MATPVVVITGCSSGIGRALCQAFHRRGYCVVATARRPEALVDLSGQGMVTLALDVTDARAIRFTVTTIVKRFGRIDMLVNNAGFGQFGPLMDLSPDILQQQFATNTFAPLALSQQVAPVMKRQGTGLIVNIGSISGLVTTPFAGAYCASKAALHALSDALRMELKPFGIQVVTVQPGAIQSNFGEAARNGLMPQRALDSWYAPLQTQIENRASLSQESATPTALFAEQLVRQLVRANPPAVIRLGEKSRWLPLLQQLLPRPLFEFLLRRQFGLDPASWSSSDQAA